MSKALIVVEASQKEITDSPITFRAAITISTTGYLLSAVRISRLRHLL
jgi:hypothetical protein